MALEVVGLKSLIESGRSEEEISEILLSFCSLPAGDNGEVHDVEFFLHKKAIHYEKLDISRTYLVFSTYKQEIILVGYFSLANKPLVISKKNFSKFSNSLKKRLLGIGHRTDSANYECKGYLLGQLGKNFSKQAVSANIISGKDLLKLANDRMLVSYEAVGGRIFYLECEDSPKLKDFYASQGFSEIQNFKSPNDLCVFVRRIS